MTTRQASADSVEVAFDRSTVLLEVAIAAPVTAALWFAIYFLLPPLSGMAEPVARLVFALKCCCIAILFTFLTGIEAVAHERLRSPAIDPLSGYETRRLRINLRYLQHTLEQLILFIPGLLALAVYCSDGSSMRAVVATAVVWILGRLAFWIGYHYGSQYRAAGAPGMLVAIVVLLYVCARFGFEIGGPAGAAAPLVLFAVAEAILFRTTAPPRA
ncbi:MAG TPA: MAPEG family protein [Candidatus Binataceae bacterium]|nr:MAPEG family protein [Candidatus Binataceae bacterium]